VRLATDSLHQSSGWKLPVNVRNSCLKNKHQELHAHFATLSKLYLHYDTIIYLCTFRQGIISIGNLQDKDVTRREKDYMVLHMTHHYVPTASNQKKARKEKRGKGWMQ
jgi:hypothetical protein